jgi:hypothetical protein
MNRASPTDLRKAMEVAQTYTKAGLWFVPVPVLNNEDYNQLVRQSDARLTLLAEDGDAADELTTRYFVNVRTRMCKVLQGRGPEHAANVRQAKREEFVEVTGNLMDLFRAETQKAKDAGWKPFGRTPYAKFMERLTNE